MLEKFLSSFYGKVIFLFLLVCGHICHNLKQKSCQITLKNIKNFVTLTHCALNSTVQSSSYHCQVPIKTSNYAIQRSQTTHKIPSAATTMMTLIAFEGKVNFT